MFTFRLLGSASLDGPDGPVAGRAALRQRVALLAVLAAEHPRPVSRDRILACVWPENGTDDARHLLRDSLYILRSALGDDAVLSTGDELRLNPDRLTCDLWKFEAALARDDPEGAVAEYGGPFLSGFHYSGAEEFEHWAEAQRSRLAGRYGRVMEQLAERDTRAGNRLKAIEWWSRLAREEPYNSRIALRYMQALEAAGDRAGALRHAKVHSDLLRAELDASPEAEVVKLAERLRLQSAAPAADAPVPPRSEPSVGTGPGRPRRRAWVAPTVIAVLVIAGLGLLGGALSRARPPELAPRLVAATPFENRTGSPDLDDLGAIAADWVIRGLMETPVVDATDVGAVYAPGQRQSAQRADSRELARERGAGIVVSGSYHRAGDSVLFAASITDVATGRVLRSLEPVGAPLDRAPDALELLRERVAAGLSPLVNALDRGYPVDPDLVAPPSLPAYREFLAGLKQAPLDWEIAAQHYRRAAVMDTNFSAPLIQLAFGASWGQDRCSLTDSVRSVLDSRRDRLTPWDRMTIDFMMARCTGDMAKAVSLLRQRFQMYPRSRSGQTHYAFMLQHTNRPRAAQEILSRLRPERDMGWLVSPDEAQPRYWKYVAASWHTLQEYANELAITESWRDSTDMEWQVIRARALAALGKESDALAVLNLMLAGSIESDAEPILTMAAELAAHGHPRASRTVAESLLVRLEIEPDIDSRRASSIATANRLLDRAEPERQALERIVQGDADTLALLQAEARIAVLIADTARAERVDSLLREMSGRPLRSPWARGGQILTRAHIAVGFGRRERAVALLKEATTRGVVYFGAAHAFHADPLLAPLRGYPPFEAMLRAQD